MNEMFRIISQKVCLKSHRKKPEHKMNGKRKRKRNGDVEQKDGV